MTFSIYTLVRPSFPSLTRWSQTRKKFAGVTVLYLCLFSRFAQDHSLGVFALEFRAFWVDPLQRVTETIRFWADLPKLRTASASIKNSGPSFTEIRYGHRVWMGCKTPDRPRSGVLHDSDYPYAFSVKDRRGRKKRQTEILVRPDFSCIGEPRSRTKTEKAGASTKHAMEM